MLGIIDTQTVKPAFRKAKAPAISVRSLRGYDAAKKVVGRKRLVLVDADGTC